MIPRRDEACKSLQMNVVRQRQAAGTDLPDAQVHVVAAAEDIAGISRKAHGHDALHALGVVHLAAVAAIVGKDAHATVIASRHKLSAGRRIVHIHHC